ncbi:MAG TPA: enoyl-CoA hydratase-related protein [Chryseolinea sp.]|nr:enoyl-CoA hydratase-related protein [Chryseolinea sp.]
MEYINLDIKNRIGTITLNRPEKRNALNFELVSELKEAFTSLESDDNVKVIVLNAKGPAFCAGADLAYLQKLQGYSYEENLLDSKHLKELFLKIYTLKKIVVAQVHGNAIAGGCGLASVCDFAFTVPDAMFGYTEVKIGFIPAIVMVFLLRKIGEGNASHLLLSGELISADEACRIGMVSKVFPPEKLEESVTAFVNKLIVENSGQAMAATKQMIVKAQSMPLEDALNFAAELNARARSTDDCQKGIRAFLNKQKIAW